MSFLKKQGRIVYVPAVYSQRWVPGYWTTWTERVCTSRPNPAYESEMARLDAQRDDWINSTDLDKPFGIRQSLPSRYIYECRDETRSRYTAGHYETVLEAEDYYRLDPLPGWNAGAHSITWLQQPPAGYEGVSARYTFKAHKGSLGIYVGLAVWDYGTSPGDVLAGVYLTTGQWRPVRDGQRLPGGGVFDYESLFTLELLPDGLAISTSGGDEAFVPYILPAPVCLDAALYLAGDEILTADVAVGGGQYGVLQLLDGLAADGPVGVARSVLAPVLGSAGIWSGGAAVLAPLDGVGWVGDGMGQGVLATVTSEGFGSVVEGDIPAFHTGQLEPVFGVGIVLSGYSGQQQDGVVAPVGDAWAYGGFGRVLSGQPQGMMGGVSGVAFGTEGSHIASLGDAAFALGRVQASVNTVVVLNSRGRLVAVFDAQALHGAAVYSQAQALGSMDGDMSLLAYIDAVVRGADGLGAAGAHGGQGGAGKVPGPGTCGQPSPDGTQDYDGGYYVWVFNARTGAVSRYLRYGFNSFAQIGGHYFGVADDGVYLLEGQQDAGRRIEARAGTGLLDLGAKELKHVSAVYLDAASDGVLSVRVQAGGQHYTYQARRSSQHNAQQRVDTGRGLRATHYSFELLNGGADFELDAMDVNVAKSARRI